MRKGKEEQIVDFCKTNGIDLIGMRNMCKQNKTRIILTFRCKDCGIEYDMMWDNVKTQEFMGCCTKCAHKRSQDYRRLEVQKLIDKFAQYGYRVITPIDKIKPRGKGETLNKAVVTVEDKSGNRFDVCYNNFHNRLNKYLDLNERGIAPETIENRKYETMARNYLDELGVCYKREFGFPDLKSNKNYKLRFDFCIDYEDEGNRKLIEVDEQHHKEKGHDLIQKTDRQKDQYCKERKIPLLRLPYTDFNDDTYKKKIYEFVILSPRVQKKRIQ